MLWEENVTKKNVIEEINTLILWNFAGTKYFERCREEKGCRERLHREISLYRILKVTFSPSRVLSSPRRMERGIGHIPNLHLTFVDNLMTLTHRCPVPRFAIASLDDHLRLY